MLRSFLSIEAIPRSHVSVHGVVSQWVGADAAAYERWRRLEAAHEIVGDEGGGLPVPTARGATLYVPGWVPGAAHGRRMRTGGCLTYTTAGTLPIKMNRRVRRYAAALCSTCFGKMIVGT